MINITLCSIVCCGIPTSTVNRCKCHRQSQNRFHWVHFANNLCIALIKGQKPITDSKEPFNVDLMNYFSFIHDKSMMHWKG